MVRSASIFDFPSEQPEFLVARVEDDRRLADRVSHSGLRRLAIEYLSWMRATQKRYEGLMYQYQELMRTYASVEDRLSYPLIEPAIQVQLEEQLERLESERVRLLEEIKRLVQQVRHRNDYYEQESEKMRDEISRELGLVAGDVGWGDR